LTFAKLLKFVIITRFSKPLLFSLAIVAFYALLFGFVTPIQPSSSLKLYGVAATEFFVVLPTLAGGFLVFKSDLDYLVLLPIEKKTIAAALFITQFISSAGFTVLIVFLYFRPLVGDLAVDQLIFLFDVILLALFATSMTVMVNRLSMKQRVAMAVAFGLWFASPLLGFPAAPTAIFTGGLLYGSLIIAVLSLGLLYLAYNYLANVQIRMPRFMIRSSTGEYKGQKSFSGLSPIRAIYRYHLSLIEFGGRINFGGSTSYQAVRVRIQLVLALTSAAAVVYALVLLGYMPGLHVSNPDELIGLPLTFTIILSMMIPLFLSQSTLANERAWLAFTSIGPTSYLRHLMLSKIFSSAILLSPFIVADILVHFISGVPGTINSAIALAFLAPVGALLTAYVASWLNPFQIKEVGMNPAQFNFKQLLTTAPTFLVLIAVSLSMFSIIAAIGASIFFVGIATILIAWEGGFRRAVFRLTESGFI
jgi:hypothetical protein